MAQGIAYSEKLSNGGTLIVNGDKWYIEYNVGGNIRIAPWQVKLYSSAMFEDIAQYPVLEHFGISTEEELAAYQEDWKYALKRADDVIWDAATSAAAPLASREKRTGRNSAMSYDNKKRETVGKRSGETKEQDKNQRTKPSIAESSKIADSYLSGDGSYGRNALGGVMQFISNILAILFLLKVSKRIFGFNTRRSTFSATFCFLWFFFSALRWCWNGLFGRR